MPTRNGILSGTLAALLLGAASHAAEPADGEQLVRDFITDVRTMSARFEQSLVDADDTILEESNGSFELKRPGRFRWTYKEPYEQLLIADGINVWNYDRDLEQVTVRPQAEVLGSTPALLLGGGGEALDDFDYAGSFTDRGTIWVRLEPEHSDSGFRRVELGFTDGMLSRMIFLDRLEQSTLIALFDVEINAPIADDRFTFTPPPGVDVVGTPQVADSAGT